MILLPEARRCIEFVACPRRHPRRVSKGRYLPRFFCPCSNGAEHVNRFEDSSIKVSGSSIFALVFRHRFVGQKRPRGSWALLRLPSARFAPADLRHKPKSIAAPTTNGFLIRPLADMWLADGLLCKLPGSCPADRFPRNRCLRPTSRTDYCWISSAWPDRKARIHQPIHRIRESRARCLEDDGQARKPQPFEAMTQPPKRFASRPVRACRMPASRRKAAASL